MGPNPIKWKFEDMLKEGMTLNFKWFGSSIGWPWAHSESLASHSWEAYNTTQGIRTLPRSYTCLMRIPWAEFPSFHNAKPHPFFHKFMPFSIIQEWKRFCYLWYKLTIFFRVGIQGSHLGAPCGAKHQEASALLYYQVQGQFVATRIAKMMLTG